MILIEGPDLVGKTTLANVLKGHLQLEYDHFGKETEAYSVLDYFARIRPNTICDRMAISKMVYGGTFNDQRLMTAGELRSIVSMISAVGGVVVIVAPRHQEDMAWYRDRLMATYKDEDELYDPEQNIKVAEAYMDLSQNVVWRESRAEQILGDRLIRVRFSEKTGYPAGREDVLNQIGEKWTEAQDSTWSTDPRDESMIRDRQRMRIQLSLMLNAIVAMRPLVLSHLSGGDL